MSFDMQKKLLGLQRNQIFNQGRLFFVCLFVLWKGEGRAKRLENCAYLWKNSGYAPVDIYIAMLILQSECWFFESLYERANVTVP